MEVNEVLQRCCALRSISGKDFSLWVAVSLNEKKTPCIKGTYFFSDGTKCNITKGVVEAGLSGVTLVNIKVGKKIRCSFSAMPTIKISKSSFKIVIKRHEKKYVLLQIKKRSLYPFQHSIFVGSDILCIDAEHQHVNRNHFARLRQFFQRLLTRQQKLILTIPNDSVVIKKGAVAPAKTAGRQQGNTAIPHTVAMAQA